MKLHFNPLTVVKAKLFGNLRRPVFDYHGIVNEKVWACVDFGAFQKPVQRLKGIDGVVMMEDRDPEFFLSFRHYKPWEHIHLNSHGPFRHLSTQHDLKVLVRELHDQNIKVTIGFWNSAGKLFGTLSQASFFREHPEMYRLPGSNDMYPFAHLEKEDISYAEYIAHQYQKLHETFSFDGLMLADGTTGFRSFNDPEMYRDQEHTVSQWADFYLTIAKTVHKTKGLLINFDCMGFSFSEASRHGADYRELSDAGLDILVFQSYPQAWGEYWLSAYADRFDLESCAINLRSVKKALKDTKTKVLYSLELGDSVEGWWAEPEKTRKQIERLDPLADGRFLVWANDLFAALKR